ncbi:hypothetical protein QYF36_012285 [Acer negundo]|nr:hypothetical protein QYF36_012285 [Acer negundo]
MDLFRKAMGPVNRALEDVGWKKTNIHEIVFLGGSTIIPKDSITLGRTFLMGRSQNSINPDEVFAYGVVVQGLLVKMVKKQKSEVCKKCP